MSEKSANALIDWKTIIGLMVIFGVSSFVWPLIQQKMQQKPAQNFEFQTLDGTSGELSGFQGEPVILHFWATWCQVCQFEMPEIKQLEKKVKVLNIASDSGSDKEVLSFARKHQMRIENIVNDQSQLIMQQYGVVGFPTTVVVDAQGVIQWFKVGKVTAGQVMDRID